MPFGSNWEKDFEKRMDNMANKMDDKFKGMMKKSTPPTPPKRPSPSTVGNRSTVSVSSSSRTFRFGKDSKTLIVDGQNINIEGITTIVIEGEVETVKATNCDTVKANSSVINIDNQNGDVKAAICHGSIRNQNGDVKIESLNGNGKINNSNGDVKIKNQTTNGKPPLAYIQEMNSRHNTGFALTKYSIKDNSVSNVLSNELLNWEDYFYATGVAGLEATDVAIEKARKDGKDNELKDLAAVSKTCYLKD